MPIWKWIDREFYFDFPPEKFPDLLERWRGAPVRVEDRVRGLDRAALTRADDGGWSIQQNIGHLIDLGYLPLQRLDQILRGDPTLVGADMTNARTNEADHNDRSIDELLAEFRNERHEAVARFAALSQDDWAKSALHARLKQPMRIVDILYFDSEHDDYHITRIAELSQRLGSPRSV